MKKTVTITDADIENDFRDRELADAQRLAHQAACQHSYKLPAKFDCPAGRCGICDKELFLSLAAFRRLREKYD